MLCYSNIENIEIKCLVRNDRATNQLEGKSDRIL